MLFVSNVRKYSNQDKYFKCFISTQKLCHQRRIKCLFSSKPLLSHVATFGAHTRLIQNYQIGDTLGLLLIIGKFGRFGGLTDVKWLKAGHTYPGQVCDETLLYR